MGNNKNHGQQVVVESPPTAQVEFELQQLSGKVTKSFEDHETRILGLQETINELVDHKNDNAEFNKKRTCPTGLAGIDSVKVFNACMENTIRAALTQANIAKAVTTGNEDHVIVMSDMIVKYAEALHRAITDHFEVIP